MPERIHAGQHGQAEGQCHAHVADAELVSVGPDHVRGQYRRSAASQYQPERAEKLGDKSFHHLGIPREWPAGGPRGMLEQVLAEDVRTALRRSEEHTSELQSLMRISYAVFCLKKNKHPSQTYHSTTSMITTD